MDALLVVVSGMSLSGHQLAGSGGMVSTNMLPPWEHFSKVQQQAPASPWEVLSNVSLLLTMTTTTSREHPTLAPLATKARTISWRWHRRERTNEEGRECSVFDKRWVHDPTRYPLYEVAECSFLNDQVDRRRNDHPNSGYEQWEWQPRGCVTDARFDNSKTLWQCRLAEPKYVSVARLHHLHNIVRPVADAHPWHQLFRAMIRLCPFSA